MNEWLADERLEPWLHRLGSRESSVRGPSSLFALLGEAKTGIAGQLHSLGIRFAYNRYIRGSLIIHGSSVDQFLEIGESIAPGFGSSNFDADLGARSVANSCDHVLVRLQLLKGHVWPAATEGESRQV